MTNVHRILAKMGDSAGKILQNSYVIVTELVTRVQYVIRQDCTDRALTFFLKILQSSKIKKIFFAHNLCGHGPSYSQSYRAQWPFGMKNAYLLISEKPKTGYIYFLKIFWRVEKKNLAHVMSPNFLLNCLVDLGRKIFATPARISRSIFEIHPQKLPSFLNHTSKDKRIAIKNYQTGSFFQFFFEFPQK